MWPNNVRVVHLFHSFDSQVVPASPNQEKPLIHSKQKNKTLPANDSPSAVPSRVVICIFKKKRKLNWNI